MILREPLKHLADWSWPTKFLVGATVSTLVGGGSLSFLLEHATHTYALSYGFRPPVEGLPYLPALVSFSSVALLLVAAVLSATIVGLVGSAARYFERDAKENKVPWLTSLPLWKSLLIAVVVSVAIATIYVFIRRTSGPTEALCGWPMIYCVPEAGLSVSYYAYWLMVGTPIIFTMFRPAFAWVAASGAIAVYYIWLGMNVVPPDQYSRLLRATGFGGGLPITIEVLPTQERTNPETIDGHLLLRTVSTVVVYSEPSHLILEYPLSRISRVSYPSGGFSKLAYRLPQRVLLLEGR